MRSETRWAKANALSVVATSPVVVVMVAMGVIGPDRTLHTVRSAFEYGVWQSRWTFQTTCWLYLATHAMSIMPSLVHSQQHTAKDKLE
mmetsp:Transcript_2274/g.6976  ORF Transcript_2274/g.6976 Transcript_2274/m.6976 type:complete len:88 (-) Transcript_2274:854-1117(-)